ncbi:MAG: hypothetical protein AAB131_10360 [Actinomycetota bacterium]
MPQRKEQFVAELVECCPSLRDIVDEHVRDFDGEVLLHLLIADVRRFALGCFQSGESDVLSSCLDVVAGGLSLGDDYVENAVAVSFVEDTPWWDPSMEPFMAVWPDALRSEVEHQRGRGGASG